MATARTTLEALITNDPENPAIREFVVKVQAIMDKANQQNTVPTDIAALVLIQLALSALERRLQA